MPQQYSAEVLTSSALGVIDRAIWDQVPSEKYQLSVPNSKFNLSLRLRDFFCFKSNKTTVHRV